MSDISDLQDELQAFRTHIEKRDQDILITLNELLGILGGGHHDERPPGGSGDSPGGDGEYNH